MIVAKGEWKLAGHNGGAPPASLTAIGANGLILYFASEVRIFPSVPTEDLIMDMEIFWAGVSLLMLVVPVLLSL